MDGRGLVCVGSETFFSLPDIQQLVWNVPCENPVSVCIFGKRQMSLIVRQAKGANSHKA